MRIKHCRALVVGLVLSVTCLAEKLEVSLVPQTLVQTRLESGVVRPSERQSTIRDLFLKAGCAPDEQRVDKKTANVVCTLPGQTPETIVVGGHFDFIDSGKGIVDDWSGTSLLPSLYEALKTQPRKHTYVFVAFAAEERGLVGSSRFVKNMAPDQRSQTQAFVNLECLGLSPVKVWTHRSAPILLNRLNEVATAIGVTLQGIDVDAVGDDDTHPFLSAHIPVISIHSLTQETLPVLHNARDKLEAINFNDYYTAYKLCAYYLAYLDVKLP